jgi:aerobic carbon-monoxide dehydrogenase small subunit
LLENTSSPTRDDIVEAISANICRCTGYGQIVEAIEVAAERLRTTNRPVARKFTADTGASVGRGAESDAPHDGRVPARTPSNGEVA